MSQASAARTFEVRHLQLVRAVFAAIAALMITFSSDHSAAVGLAVFSGFAIATGIAFLASAWLVFPAGRRWPAVLLGILTVAAGMAGGVPPLRTDVLFFVVVIAWAVSTGAVELASGWRGLRPARTRPEDERFAAPLMPRAEARDALVIGIVTIVLAIGTALVPTGFVLQYSIEGAGSFTLTGITIAVGVFGAYAAIVAVYLGIAGFSPAKAAVPEAPGERDGEQAPGGIA